MSLLSEFQFIQRLTLHKDWILLLANLINRHCSLLWCLNVTEFFYEQARNPSFSTAKNNVSWYLHLKPKSCGSTILVACKFVLLFLDANGNIVVFLFYSIAWLSWLRFFVVFLSPSRHIQGLYLTNRPRQLSPASFPIHHSLTTPSLDAI
jgi:hypothetical protein